MMAYSSKDDDKINRSNLGGTDSQGMTDERKRMADQERTKSEPERANQGQGNQAGKDDKTR